MGNGDWGARTMLELRVGTTHTVAILVHLRRADLDWFNSSMELHRRELFQLIGKKILPREFSEELDRHHEDKAESNRPSKEKGAVVVGERNRKAEAKTKAGKKRKRGKKEEETKKVNTSKSTEEKRKYDKQVFGQTLQVIYRLEDIRLSESALLLYVNTKHSSDGKKSNKSRAFRQLPKLSKQLSLWCFPFDPQNPLAPNPDGVGFPRPELIPIASLFRQPNEGSTST